MERLKSLRVEKKISQEKLAEQIGTSQQLIHKYEHGSEPDIRTMKLIANFFNTSVDYLIGNTDLRIKIDSLDGLDLNEHEVILLDKYRLLPANARRGISLLIDELTVKPYENEERD